MLGRRLIFGRLVYSLLRRRPNSDRLAPEGPLRCVRGGASFCRMTCSAPPPSGIPRAVISIVFSKGTILTACRFPVLDRATIPDLARVLLLPAQARRLRRNETIFDGLKA